MENIYTLKLCVMGLERDDGKEFAVLFFFLFCNLQMSVVCLLVCLLSRIACSLATTAPPLPQFGWLLLCQLYQQYSSTLFCVVVSTVTTHARKEYSSVSTIFPRTIIQRVKPYTLYCHRTMCSPFTFSKDSYPFYVFFSTQVGLQ